MFLLKYYGIDWLMFFIIVIHLWMLAKKWRMAFIFGASGSALGAVLGILVGSAGFAIMNAVFTAMHIRAYKKWSEVIEDND